MEEVTMVTAVEVRSTSTQTVPWAPTPELTLDVTRDSSRRLGQYMTDIRCLRATVRGQLKSHLRMPTTESASMKVNITFLSTPLMAWKMPYGKDSFEWHSTRTRMESVHVGLLQSPRKLNETLDMGKNMQYGNGSCKLAVPEKGVARSIISYAPTFEVWHKAQIDGTMESVLSGFLVILDESGEMRTPPNHSWTDAEEADIKLVMMENLRKMASWEWPLSEMFLEHLDEWEAAQVQELEAEGM